MNTARPSVEAATPPNAALLMFLRRTTAASRLLIAVRRESALWSRLVLRGVDFILFRFAGDSEK
jgi:hypothetical protein